MEYKLIERVTGKFGKATCWTYDDGELTPAAQEKSPHSLKFWLVELPEYADAEEGITGVFMASYLNLNHKSWGKTRKFLWSSPDPAYHLEVAEAYGDNPCIDNPGTCEDTDDTDVVVLGSDLIAADQHMWFLVEALLDGRIDPIKAEYTGFDDEDDFWNGLRALAELDPDAHEQELNPPPDYRIPLFDLTTLNN